MNPEIRDVPARRVAYLRALGRYPETFPKLWPRFGQLAMEGGLFKIGGARLSILHDEMGKVPAEQLRGDAAIEVPVDWQPTGELQVQEVPAGLFAVVEHRGDYRGLGQTWGELLGKWLPASEFVRRPAASYEIYVSDPRSTATPDLRTEIYLPVVKKEG